MQTKKATLFLGVAFLVPRKQPHLYLYKMTLMEI
jgi:hypothetical protein